MPVYGKDLVGDPVDVRIGRDKPVLDECLKRRKVCIRLKIFDRFSDCGLVLKVRKNAAQDRFDSTVNVRLVRRWGRKALNIRNGVDRGPQNINKILSIPSCSSR